MDIFELPKIAIDGSVYALNSKDNSLIDHSNHANKMKLVYIRGLFTFYILFDRQKRNVATGTYEMPRDSYSLIDVRIPFKVADMEKMPTDNQIKEINEMAKTNRYNFVMVDNPFNLRISGQFPEINIAGDSFIVDLRLNELRSKELFSPLRFDDFEYSKEHGEYLFFYHKPSQSLAFPNDAITESLNDIFLVQIPEKRVLDPVALARNIGHGDAAFYPEHPIRMEHTAKVTPLRETILAEVLKENIKKRDAEDRNDGLHRR